MTSQPRKQTTAINIMLNVSRSKGNQAMKFLSVTPILHDQKIKTKI